MKSVKNYKNTIIRIITRNCARVKSIMDRDLCNKNIVALFKLKLPQYYEKINKRLYKITDIYDRY